MLEQNNKIAIGIDFGTCNSVVARMEGDKAQVILIDNDRYTERSVVAFTNERRIIGTPAFAKGTLNPQNTIFEVKRLIGKRMDDDTVNEDIKSWPFIVSPDKDKKPQVCVELRSEDRRFYPEQICAMILTKLRQEAEKKLGTTVSKAVITVPAAFNDAQRQAVVDAGKMANLEVLRIINEPTAAALAYAHENNLQWKENRKILVFDLGGGTFDVSILEVRKGELVVMCSRGDAHLGGADFDNCLLQRLVSKATQTDLNPQAKWKLRRLCENVKIRLSMEEKCIIGDNDDSPICAEILRSEFEQACGSLFERVKEITNQCLRSARLTPRDIEKVVLVGGSTRIPKVRKLLCNMFGDYKISKAVNPDEAVALGAAIQASSFMRSQSSGLMLKDCLPFSLGVACEEGDLSFILFSGTKLPAEEEKVYTTNHEKLTLHIYEGESKSASQNVLLDKFEVSFPSGAGRENHFPIKFRVDENNILIVTAGSTNHVVQRDRKQFTDEEISAFIQVEKDLQHQDEAADKIDVLNDKLTTLAFSFDAQKQVEIWDWMKENSDADSDVLERKIADLRQYVYA